MSDLVKKPPPPGHLAAPNEGIDWSRLSDEARQTLQEFTFARETQRTYKSAWESFVRWCAAEDRTAAPASPYDVADYLAHLGSLQPTSVSRCETAAAAIACAMALAGLPYQRGNEAVRAMLKALRRKIGVAPKHQKTPLIAEVLTQVCEPLGDSLVDTRDRALLVLAFLSACRRSNLSALDVGDLTFTREGLDVELRRSKTDQEGKGFTVAIPLQPDPRLCATQTVRAWMNAASIEDGPLFRSIDRWGHVGSRLGGQEVCRIVQKLTGDIQGDFGAHSTRSGFCTSAADNGVPLDAIMAQTGHTDPASVMPYIRRSKRFQNNAATDLLGGTKRNGRR